MQTYGGEPGPPLPGGARPGAIPKIFHFVFGLRRQTEPFHLVHYLCLRSCLEVNRPDRIVFHHHHRPFGRYWDLLADQLELRSVRPVGAVDRARYPRRSGIAPYLYAHHADFLRLQILQREGGVYADIDTLFVAPIPERLFAQPFVLGREDPVRDATTGVPHPSLCNALIMAPAGSAFGRTWLAQMPAHLDGSWSGHSCRLAQQLWERHPDWIHVEPPRSFYPYMWTRERLRALFEGLESDRTGIFSVHLWAHLWWARRRRDFSDFHAGLLDEDYLRRGETTLARLAAPYLPPPDPASGVARWVRRLGEGATGLRGSLGEVRDRLVRLVRRVRARLPERRASPRLRPLAPADEAAFRASLGQGLPGVNLLADLRPDFGLGRGALSTLDSLRTAGVEVAVLRPGHGSPPLQRASFRHPVNLLHAGGGYLADLLRRGELPRGALDGRYNIGYWLWEQEQLTPAWLPALGVLHEVWTASTRCRDAIASVTDLPVTVIPLAVEPPPDVEPDRARFGVPAEGFVFLHMCDLASLERRKNPTGVVEAYRRAFAGRADPPWLVLRLRGLAEHPDVRGVLATLMRGLDRVRVLEDTYSPGETWSLLASADSFVSLHRGEGFGLCLAESMRLGRPVIATGWGGNTDFMSPANSYPVDFELVPLEEDLLHFRAGLRWAEPDLDHAAARMREVADDPDQAARRGAQAATDLTRWCSDAAVGRRIRARLGDLVAGGP